MNLICLCLVLFARRTQSLCFMCWNLCSSKAWSQTCASKWNSLNVYTCFQTHEHSHISHICIIVVVHTHGFYYLGLAPSHHTVLYISSQFVQIEYYFWWVATDEPSRKSIMANFSGVLVFLAITTGGQNELSCPKGRIHSDQHSPESMVVRQSSRL